MPSTYSPLLRIQLIATGEQSGTWGNITNTNLGTLIEEAIAGTAEISVTAGNVTLTSIDGVTDQSRCAAIRVSGTPGVSRNIIAPAASHVYVVANGSNAAVVLKTSSSTGLTIPTGQTYLAYYDPTVGVADFKMVGQAIASTNTANTLVLRDASGNFSAGMITANLTGNVTGNASTVTTNANLTGAVTSSGNATSLGSFTSANLAAALTDETGTGANVFANTPTLVTPVLGTPTSGTLTNCTGLPVATGVSGLGTGVATFLATPSSANLAAALTDETGTGANVFANTPTLVTPVLGTPTSGTLTNCTGLPLSTGITGTLPVANGGTGATTALGAYNALSPMTTLGDITYEGAGASALRLGIGSSGQVLTVSGGVPSWATPTTGTVTSVTGTSPVVSSGGNTPAISLAASYGDTQNPYASKTANFILAAPNGSAGVPTFRAVVAADIPTLNQNTTGSSASCTGNAATVTNGVYTTGNQTIGGTKTFSVDAVVNGIKIGRGLNNDGSSTALGSNALNATTSASGSTAIGANALASATTGGLNTAVGSSALTVSTSGVSNIAVGFQTMFSNTSGSSNVATGDQALYANTTGTDNIAVGDSALISNTTGIRSVAIGTDALYSNTTAGGVTAVGYQALYSSTSASGCTAVGFQTLASNISGTNCTAMGNQALYDNTGGNNTAFGSIALRYNTTGTNNTAVGHQALLANTTGLVNTVVGTGAGSSITTGSANLALGVSSLINATTGSANIGIGAQSAPGTNAAVFNVTTESNRIVMGHTSVTNAYVQVAWTVVSDARDKTDFADVPHGLDFVTKLNPIAYRYKENRDATEGHGPVRYGFKAQEVLALEGDTPVIVDADDAEKLRFNDQSMIAVLVKAVQELKAEFEAYKLTHP